MEQEYHIIKTSLKSILKNNTNLYDLLNDSISRINDLVAHLYQFFRLLLLYEYKKSKENCLNKNQNIDYKFTVLTKEVIQIGVKVLTQESNSGKLNKDMQIIYDYFSKFYNEHYKYLGYLNKIDGNNLHQSMKYEAIQMMTSIQNNIIYNFGKYIEYYISLSFYDNHKLILLLTKDKDKKDKKIKLRTELLKVRNDILNNTFTSEEKYWNWIKIHKLLILPPNTTTHYESDIKSNPQKYIPYMIFMSEYFEKFGKVKYQFFPLRTSGIPNYCTFDTTTLVKLLIKDNSNRNDYLANISEYQETIWNLCFKMNAPAFKSNKYKFDHTILTDGYAVSVRFITEKQYNKKLIREEHKKASKQLNKIINNIQDPIEKAIILKQLEDIKEDNKFQQKIDKEEFIKTRTQEDKDTFKKKKIEFPYIDELTGPQIKELSESIRVYDDPGKRDLIKMKDEKGTEFSYSNKQRLYEMNSEKYANQINKFWGLEIKPSTKKKKRKRISKKERRKREKGNKNKFNIPGKKVSLQLKKNKRKLNKTKNVNNKLPNTIKKQISTSDDYMLIDTVNNLTEINIKEQEEITINTEHFMKILNENVPKYNIDLPIFKSLISFAILNHNRAIYNKYGIERQKILTKIKMSERNILQIERKYNNICISINKLIDKYTQLHKDEELKISCYNKKGIIDDYSLANITKKYKSLKLSILNNLNKLIEMNYNTKIKYTKLMEELIKIDDTYNEYKILNAQISRVVDVPIESNLLNFPINFEEDILNYSSNDKLKIRLLYLSHQLTNKTIFVQLKNVLTHIKANIYSISSKNQESTINRFIYTEKLKEIAKIKQTRLKILTVEKVKSFNMSRSEKKRIIEAYLECIPQMWIRNTDKIKTYINSISHPDPNYISLLNNSLNISQSLINKKQIALSLEKDLSFLRTKSCNLVQFKLYITYKNYVRHSEYGDIYKDPIFRRCRWYSYIDKSRSLENLLNRIETTFGPRDRVIIIHGDWSISKQLRNFKPTPLISLKRKLHSRFKIYDIDEFRTSILSAETGTICENISLPDKYGKLRSIHSVLTYKSGLRQNCINRDSNALSNFQFITTELLAGKSRPSRFCRTTKLEDIIKTFNPIKNGVK